MRCQGLVRLVHKGYTMKSKFDNNFFFEMWYNINFKNSRIPKELARIYWECYGDEVQVIDYSDESIKIKLGEDF
jgi:hypothetical protein